MVNVIASICIKHLRLIDGKASKYASFKVKNNANVDILFEKTGFT